MDRVSKNVSNVVEHFLTQVAVRQKHVFVCWNLNNVPATEGLRTTITNITLLAPKEDLTLALV